MGSYENLLQAHLEFYKLEKLEGFVFSSTNRHTIHYNVNRVVKSLTPICPDL